MGTQPTPDYNPPARRLRVLLVPSVHWQPAWRAFRPGEAPDPEELFRLLAERHGIDTTLVDPNHLPWNPLARRHQVLRGIDPVRALSTLLRRRRADIVLACFEPGAVALLALRRLARFRPRIAIIDIGLTESWALRRRMLDYVIPRVDAIYPLGTNQVDYIHDRWRTAADVRFIHQHVDTTFYQPGPPVPDGPVLSVGDDAGRDFPTLLAAWQGLGGKLVLKTGLVDAAGLPAGVEVIARRLPGTAFRALFQDAAVVAVPLRPTLTASGVGTLLEAMAMGKPIVVSDSPGIRDYVEDGQTALVVPCGDVGALQGALRRLLDDPALRTRLGAAARCFAERHCSYAAHAASLSQALRDLAG